MAELSDGAVFRVVLGGIDDADRRVLLKTLEGMNGVNGFEISDEGVLVVSLVSADQQGSLARALMVAGIVPLSTDEIGSSYEGGTYAC
jgi:hypothetical protein